MVYTGECNVARTDNFYHYIGLYNQFVGGWEDCYSPANIQQWFEVDGTIMTPLKEQYLDM